MAAEDRRDLTIFDRYRCDAPPAGPRRPLAVPHRESADSQTRGLRPAYN